MNRISHKITSCLIIQAMASLTGFSYFGQLLFKGQLWVIQNERVLVTEVNKNSFNLTFRKKTFFFFILSLSSFCSKRRIYCSSSSRERNLEFVLNVSFLFPGWRWIGCDGCLPFSYSCVNHFDSWEESQVRKKTMTGPALSRFRDFGLNRFRKKLMCYLKS